MYRYYAKLVLMLLLISINVENVVVECFVTPVHPADISVLTIAAAEASQALDALRRASVPAELDSAIAIGISEAIAGVIGGTLSRTAADILGDKKKDSLTTKISTTGAFFGTRAAIRGLARIAGLPRPLALALSSLIASLISEGTKAFGRNKDLSIDGVNHDEQEEMLKVSEIGRDIAKWLIYDGLEDQIKIYDDDVVQVLRIFGAGCASAIVATEIGDLLEFYVEKGKGGNKATQDDESKSKSALSKLTVESISKIDPTEVKKGFLRRFANAAIEGGVLFAVFHVVVNLLHAVVPDQYNSKFLFDQVIETLEDGLTGI